ncbi:hypothetical protein DPEC_G00049370, partial [Dallia pectoralis]
MGFSDSTGPRVVNNGSVHGFTVLTIPRKLKSYQTDNMTTNNNIIVPMPCVIYFCIDPIVTNYIECTSYKDISIYKHPNKSCLCCCVHDSSNLPISCLLFHGAICLDGNQKIKNVSS